MPSTDKKITPDILLAIRNFNLLGYIFSPANAADWCHFTLMLVGWLRWYAHVKRTSNFSMESSYEILHSPLDQTPARILRTNAEQEMRFLQFSQALADLEQGLRLYSNITSLCGDFDRCGTK